jgi:integrase
MTDDSATTESPPIRATRRKANHGDGGAGNKQRADGRWQWRITLPDGRRKYFYGKTKQEAKAKAKAALRDLERGLDIGSEDVTVRAYLEAWINDTAANRVRPSTLHAYRSHIEHHIVPAMGRVKLRNLTPQHVNRMLAAIVANGATPTTANRVRATLRTALSSAVKWGIVSRNVAALADARREQHQRVNPLEVEQILQFLEHVKDHRHGPLITVAIVTGMRQGELFALRWGPDIDLAAGVVHVRHTLIRGMDGRPHLGDPKTAQSRRSIMLSRDATDALERQREIVTQYRLMAGSRWQEHDLVFPTSIGTFADGPTVTRAIQQLLEEAGLPRQRFYDLRHATASLQLAEGADIFEVKELLGHSQISLTANTYGHMTRKLAGRTAARMDRALRVDTNPDTKRDDTEEDGMI